MEYERVAYDIALRSLERQERGLEELRARTGVLLGAASLGVTFLGTQALDGSPPAGLVMATLLSFVVAVGASGFILLPDSQVSFAGSGAATYERLFDEREDLAEVYRRLIYELHSAWLRNDERFRLIATVFRLAAASFAAEILVLATLISGSLW